MLHLTCPFFLQPVLRSWHPCAHHVCGIFFTPSKTLGTFETGSIGDIACFVTCTHVAKQLFPLAAALVPVSCSSDSGCSVFCLTNGRALPALFSLFHPQGPRLSLLPFVTASNIFRMCHRLSVMLRWHSNLMSYFGHQVIVQCVRSGHTILHRISLILIGSATHWWCTSSKVELKADLVEV